MRYVASASSKTILFGEHAVVYGYPALAVPISSLRAFAEIEARRSNSGLDIISLQAGEHYHLDSRESGYVDDRPLVRMVECALNRLNIRLPDAVITITSRIPIAGGLGSGAAVATAVVRVLAIHANTVLDGETTNDIVFEIEKIFHGTPSGIDNSVIVHERSVVFQQGRALGPVSPCIPLSLLVADTGQPSHTKPAVAAVRRLVVESPDESRGILSSIGELVFRATKAIDEGNLLDVGCLMNENHELLRQLQVSSPELDKLVSAARNAGALGAKMSGGGRGGNMIALVEAKSQGAVEYSLRRAGATHVIAATVL